MRVLQVSVLTLGLHGCAVFQPRDQSSPRADGGETGTSTVTGEAGASATRDRGENRTATGPTAIALLDSANAGERIAERMKRLARRGDLGLAGTEAGYYMDVQEAQLRQDLQEGQAGIFRDADSIMIRISGSAAFATGSSELSTDMRPLLDTISSVLTEYRRTLVIVNSHTDNRGDSDYNQKLSEQRALVVSRFLAGHGVPAERILAVGHGESSPLPAPAGADNRWSDRRIEIRLDLIMDTAS